MKTKTDPSLQQKALLCLLCLFWNDSLVQASLNSSSILRTTMPDVTSKYEEKFQETAANLNPEETSAEESLVPFDEECIAHVIHINRGGDDGRDTFLSCSLRNGLSYPIPSVSQDWIDEQMILGELISTETMMTLPSNAMLNERTHEIHMTGIPKLWNYGYEEREQRRKLRRLSTTGTKTVLVVRIAATDTTTTPTAAQLGNYIFGDDGNDYNLKVQTEACSSNQLKINKASDRTGLTTNISNGIVTITIGVAATSGAATVENVVTAGLNGQFGVTSPNELADHLMYCFPTGVTAAGVVAYAVVGGYLSYYNDAACTYPSAQIHEVGHNYNMGHSSDSEKEYGDQSGLMGFSYTYTDIPKMCFNAAKSWQLGWYSSKADSITPSSTSATYSTSLAGIVDYSTTSNKCLIEIQQTSSTTFYYINYNRATGFNVQPIEGVNQVQVVSKDTSVETNVSMALAALDAGQSFTISNFNGNNGETLTITFTSLENNEANVNIALTGFPTTPTLDPSVTPSRTPSTIPSKQPSTSLVPSSNPSANASSNPSKEPSNIPSIIPSLMPSKAPSSSNNPSASAKPSNMPSSSDAPSLLPSTLPSNNPSSSNMPSSVAGSPTLSNTPSTLPSNNPSSDVSTSPSKMASSAPSVAPEPVNCFEGILDDNSTMYCNCASDCLDDNAALLCDCEEAEACCDKIVSPPPTPPPTTPPPNATPPPTPPPTMMATNNPTADSQGKCLVTASTGSCDGLIANKNVQDMEQDQCDCYNFCDGTEIPCCPFGNSCSVSCDGQLVAGCLAPEPTPPPTTTPLACQVAVNTQSCGSVSWDNLQPVQGCDCYNFCDGTYSGCCAAGQDQDCGMDCSGALVAGCSYDQPNGSPTAAPVVSTPPPTMATPTANQGPSTYFFWPGGMT